MIKPGTISVTDFGRGSRLAGMLCAFVAATVALTLPRLAMAADVTMDERDDADGAQTGINLIRCAKMIVVEVII